MTTNNRFFGWTISQWRNAYREGLVPKLALENLRTQLNDDDPAWIYIVSAEELASQLHELNNKPNATQLPLYGIPFAVKDNIDVAGVPTTAACPAFTYIAKEDATCIARLKNAGAIVLGKTNLDQFATGLVGTRSPYGKVSNAFNSQFIAGGSSSGSAVSVATGLVPFSLGTDTAGSGRVPAGLNNIVGLKPTKGRISTSGLVPACRSLDCISVFALSVADAESVAEILEGFDEVDSYSRTQTTPTTYFPQQPRFGIPSSLNWFGDTNAEAAWQLSLEKLRKNNIDLVELDFSLMYQLAELLYGGPWVAERYAALNSFMKNHLAEMNEIVRSIISKATHFSAVDGFNAEYQRAALSRKIHRIMQGVDALLVPTVPHHPTLVQVEKDPIGVNSQLGTYTNFVNLADCCALSLPATMRSDGLPFGITLIAGAWQDAALARFGKKWQKIIDLPLGATDKKLGVIEENTISNTHPPNNYVRLAVVGAHLSEMPLNKQLQERNAIFVEQTYTSENYRLFALPNTTPPKPGLIRSDVESAVKGAKIIVELWDIPLIHFGSFVALIPAPLGIGTLTLDDGREVKGFICEACAVKGATDITHFGGWRAYIKSLTGEKNV
jgi:allophanate hydrolase